LRYLLEKTPMGTKIAFLDYRSEQNDFSKLILSSLLVGTGGLAAFFVISIFLSRWALYPVQKTWKQQQQFVSDASHELKTPLTVILADTDIVLSHPKDSVHDQSKWLEDVRYEAQRMKKLIESMLFLAKSDEISAKRKKSEFSMSDAVWSSLLSFESIAFEKGIAMKNDILPDISIIGNEDEIRRLIDVLLDNAMKYTEPGGKVTTSLDRQGDKVRLCVHNTGKEIAREHLGNLFRRFYRADESRSGVSEGFGLGLSIASSIADRHNAKLSVESASGSGTCFSVLFQTPPRSTAKHP
jgi:signal transduction histidine kinase